MRNCLVRRMNGYLCVVEVILKFLKFKLDSNMVIVRKMSFLWCYFLSCSKKNYL